jgi:uncharacterized protein
MKKIYVALSLICFSSSFLKAQELMNKIEVIGKAELDVVPEILNYTITLQEYKKSDGSKVTIETLEKSMVKAVEDLGISRENFSIMNIGGNRPYNPNERNGAFLENRNYSIKVSSVNEINGLIPKLDSMGISSAFMNRATNKRSAIIEKQLREEAIKDAKEKANSIAESINKKLGEIILIQENNVYDLIGSNNDQYKKGQDSGLPLKIRGFRTDIPVEKIKVSYHVKVIFQMK